MGPLTFQVSELSQEAQLPPSLVVSMTRTAPMGFPSREAGVVTAVDDPDRVGDARLDGGGNAEQAGAGDQGDESRAAGWLELDHVFSFS